MVVFHDILYRFIERHYKSIEIFDADCTIEKNPVTSYTSECKLTTVQKHIDTIGDCTVVQIPVVPFNVSRACTIESQLKMRIGHIEPEKVHSDIREITSDVDVAVKRAHYETHATFVDFQMLEEPAPKRPDLPSPDVEIIELHADEPDISSYAHILKACQDVYTHANLRYVYKKPFTLKSTIPKSISKPELLVLWKELLKKVPTRRGADLELMGVFQGIEIDRFKSMKYDARRNELHLYPYPLSHQPSEARGRYDIIYGRFKPNGRILNAVMESD